MEKETQKNTPNFTQMMKELVELQTTNTKLQVAIFVRESREQINSSASNLSQNIQESAKAFGQRAQRYAQKITQKKDKNKHEHNGEENITVEYKDILQQINDEFEQEMREILKDKQYYELQELRSLHNLYILKRDRKEIRKSDEHKEDIRKEKELKRDIKIAKENGDDSLVDALSYELQVLQYRPMNNINKLIKKEKNVKAGCRNGIRACNKRIIKCRKDRLMAIIKANTDKNVQIDKTNKTTVVRRTIDSILNKVNGLNRFKNIVVAPIKQKIETIVNETIPEIKEDIQNRQIDASEKMQEIREGAQQIRESVSERIDNVVQGGKQTMDNIIQTGRETKEKVLATMQSTIENKQQEQVKLQEKYNEPRTTEESR